MLDEAMEYAIRGLSVIPIEPGTKKPALTTWLAYQQRIATDDELRLWFDGTGNNIGIVAGRVSGNLAVIDCDDMATAAIVARAIPATLSVRTGKGRHFYVLTSEEMSTTSWTLNGGLHHVKATGGYVVAPPSVHPSGAVYRWENDRLPAEMLVTDLRAALLGIGAKHGLAQRSQEAHEAGWVARLLETPVREGERHEQFARLAGYLSGRLHMDETCAVMRLWMAAQVDGYADMPEYRNPEAQVREWYRQRA
ncbi:MAG: bifunctional DNA primase/polymerase [Patescibacteria group bacterium]|nr:bifunctional DNA primase/polymerase [Patescibacteria group bacterium]